MKIIIILIFVLIQALNIAICDEPESDEIYLENQTSVALNVHLYPVSMIMNGESQYNLLAAFPKNTSARRFNYNAGARTESGVKKLIVPIPPGGGFNFDIAPAVNNEDVGSFGSGIYKIKFTWFTTSIDSTLDSVFYEQDAGVNYDITFTLVDNTSEYGGPVGKGIIYRSHLIGGAVGPDKWIGLLQGYLKCWNPYPYIDTLPRRSKNFGNFLYDEGDTLTLVNPYTIFPLDSRADCDLVQYTNQNQIFENNGSGILTLNLTIDKDIYTRDTLIDNPTNIVVTKGAYLKINPWYEFNMITPSYPTGGSNNLIIQDSAYLILGSHSKIIVDGQNKLTLGNKGLIAMYPYSEIIFEPGSIFCNLGGKIKGSGGIIFRSGYHYYNCLVFAESVFEDSTKLVLEDSSDLEIPDDFTLTLKGSQTYMLLNSKTVLKLGDNSKIIFDGENCFLDAKSTSSIQFGESASIVFRTALISKPTV